MPERPKFTIYADANDVSEDGDYYLTLDQSRRDLEKLGSARRNGTPIVLNVQNEFEVYGELHLSDDGQFWLGRPDLSTMRYLDGQTPEK